MPLKVRNTTTSTTVFAKVIDGNSIKVTWGPKGQPNDVQRCPDALAQDTDFLNSLETGILVVESGPEAVMAMLKDEVRDIAADRAEAAARAAADIEATMDRKQDRDILSVTCIGPAGENRTGYCGKAVLVMNAAKADVPPLCEAHAHLADQFYLSEAGSKGEGATESKAGVVRREWKQIQMTAPQRNLV